MPTTETLRSLECGGDVLCNLQRTSGWSGSSMDSAFGNINFSPSKTSKTSPCDSLETPFPRAKTGIDSNISKVDEAPQVHPGRGNVRYVFEFPNTPMLHLPQKYAVWGIDSSQKHGHHSQNTEKDLPGQIDFDSRHDGNTARDLLHEDKQFLSNDFSINTSQPQSLRENELWPLLIWNEEAWTRNAEKSRTMECMASSDCYTISQCAEPLTDEHMGSISVLGDSLEDQTADPINSLMCEETFVDEDFIIDGLFPCSASKPGETNLAAAPQAYRRSHTYSAPNEVYALDLIQTGCSGVSIEAKSPPRKPSSRRQTTSRPPGIYFEGLRLSDSPVKGSGNRSGTNQPSRFCHICLRRAERLPLMACGRLRNGLCRKVVCERCFNDFGYDWESSAAPGSGWICTHCRKTSVQLSRKSRRHHIFLIRLHPEKTVFNGALTTKFLRFFFFFFFFFFFCAMR